MSQRLIPPFIPRTVTKPSERRIFLSVGFDSALSRVLEKISDLFPRDPFGALGRARPFGKRERETNVLDDD